MRLPDPVRLIEEFDRHIDDDHLNIGAAVEQVFEDADGPVQYYARRRLDQELDRRGGADEDLLAGIGLDDSTRAAVDAWIERYVAVWRARFGDVEERPPS